MINRGDTVVQVGMWREEAAIRIANSVGPNGRVLFVEVCQSAMKTLKETMKDSVCQETIFVNKGAWDTKGEFDLIVDENSAATRLDTGRRHPGHDQGNVQVVDVDTIENICRDAGIDEIDYIEITVNGAELHVLRGMGDLIGSTKRLWIAGLTRDPDTEEPLNIAIRDFLLSKGLNAQISHCGAKANSDWGRLDGHVYGWQKR